MKKLVLTSLLICSIIGFGFAEEPYFATSKLNESTKSLFNNDVDNSVDLKGWQSVNPANLFTFVGYENGDIDLGVAHTFGTIYTGFYFNGVLIPTSQTDKTNNEGSDPTKQVTKNAHQYNFAALVGINKLSFRFGFNYDGDTCSNIKDGPYTKKYNVGLRFDAGIPAFLLGWDTFYSAGVILDLGTNKGSTKADKAATNYTITNNGTSVISILAAADFEKAASFTQNIDLDLRYDISTFAKKPTITYNGGTETVTIQEGAKDNLLTVTPSYTLTVPASDMFTFKLRADLPMAFGSSNGFKARKVGSANKVYNDYDAVSTFELNPELKAAVKLNIKPQLSFNAGVGFALPSFESTTTKSKTCNADNGTVTNTNKSSTSIWTEADGACSFSSGLTWTPAKDFNIDFTYQILSGIFSSGNFDSNLSTSSYYSIWETLNDIFVHNVSIQVSFKF